jgi:hypothetical protein
MFAGLTKLSMVLSKLLEHGILGSAPNFKILVFFLSKSYTPMPAPFLSEKYFFYLHILPMRVPL